MAFPAARFIPAGGDPLGLRIPADLASQSPPSVPAPAEGAAALAAPDGGAGGQSRAVELDRVVPPSGNLWLAGQQIWLGPAMTGRTVRLWAGPDRVHVLLDGHRIKTLPSRLDTRDLARLAAAGGRPAGPPPLPPSSGAAVELERTVNASGNISLGNCIISAGLPLAGQRSRCVWTARSPTFCPAAPWSAPSPAPSPPTPVPGCAEPAAELPGHRSYPNLCTSSGGYPSAARS